VYHVARLVAALGEAEFLRVNRDGTRALLEAATRRRPDDLSWCLRQRPRVRPCQVSPLKGDEPPNPVTIYGR
jgi:hypothetical protein